MFKKAKVKLTNLAKENKHNENKHWSYSFSLSLFIVGGIIFLLATIENSSYITILSSLIIVLGIFTFPNFKSSYIDNFAKGMFKFSISVIGVVADIILFKYIMKNIHNHNPNPFYRYLELSILTFFIARYYIDVIHHVISGIIKGANKKADIIRKVWKIILTLVGFLVSLATLTNIVINIVNVISNAI